MIRRASGAEERWLDYQQDVRLSTCALAIFSTRISLEPNVPAGASKSKEINVSWIELTSWLKTASTVPTEVRLPAGCFHWGSGWPPQRDPPGEVWAETGGPNFNGIWAFSGGLPGRGPGRQILASRKNRKIRKTHLLFRFFVPGKSYGKSIRNFLGNGRISLNTKFRIKILRRRRRRRTREGGEGAGCSTSSTTTSTTSSTTTYMEVDGSANSTDPGR